MASPQRARLTSNLRIGTMGWSYNFWKGGFYPQDLPTEKMLTYYSTQFNTVEIDNTFYRIPRESTVTEWKRQTPLDFVFSLKFPQVITHVKMLRNCEQETEVFLERAQLLEEKLGVLLLQFPFSFQKDRFLFLEKYIRKLPKTFRFALEIRHKSLLGNELLSLLRENNTATVWTDNPLQNLEQTADFLYIRWEGSRKLVKGTLGKAELDRASDFGSWASKIKNPLSKNVRVFGYFSKYYSGFPPQDAKRFLDTVGSRLWENSSSFKTNVLRLR